MPCFHPLEAWRGRVSGPSGKARIVFKQEDSCGIKLQLPCGQCIGCRLERSRQWAVRCMHEAQLHADNCFVTLTYNDENLPEDGSLNKRHFQLFCKRLRKRVSPFRFFHCGEYGDQFRRPHYHACLFGLDFPDKKLFSKRDDIRVYESPTLSEVWGLGFATVGALTFESAAYVARYVLKKVTGPDAQDFYGDLQPEYVTMSRRPGIAASWFRKYVNEVYPADEVIARGHSSRPPRFYDNLYEAAEPVKFDSIKRKRVDSIKSHAADLTPQRLAARERVTEAKLQFLKRPVD